MTTRLTKEFQQLSQEPLEWATVALEGDNLFKWRCVLQGPPDTPYSAGFFFIDLALPSNYPFKPPEVTFLTKTYHPNIQQKDGKICTQILGQKWSPQIRIPEVLLIVRQMLAEPNLDSPLDEEIARQYREHKAAFDKTAKEWTKKHAKKNQTF
eukprot:TRINITY_DN2150_c0_g2_i4.p1 TRINITY_DN2150_c0_g2~~TRINITY_DN2150_c0_g2_i4.p1  ORF type:complete len:153 (+),score=20.83 TRINITY_DN2150_c0_g2_i4:134-592(+)